MKYDAAINLALDAHELLVRKAAAFDALLLRARELRALFAFKKIPSNLPAERALKYAVMRAEEAVAPGTHPLASFRAVEAHHGIGEKP